jgi:hypothetical protein
MPTSSLAASTFCALAAGLLGQVPAGVCIVTQSPTPAQRPAISFVDPLTSRVTPILDLLQVVGGSVRCALGTGAGGDLLVATSGPAGDVIVRVKLFASVVSGASAFAHGFNGTITSLAALRGSGYAAGTSAGVFRIPAGGGAATALVPATLGLECRDLVVAGNDLAALLADQISGAHRLLTVPVTGGTPVLRPLSLTKLRSIGYHDSAGLFVFGNEAGEVHAVDPQTLVPMLLVAAGRGPIRSIAFATNHKYLVLGTNGAVQVLNGRTVGPPLPVIAGSDVAEIDWVPFGSKFAVESRGCPGTSGIPLIANFGGDPFPGNASFGVSLASAAPSSQALLGLGVDRSTIDLTPLGAPGCLALTMPIVSIVFGTGAAGKALAQLPVPADASIAGAGVSLQWYVLDSSNVLGLVTSARGRAEF